MKITGAHTHTHLEMQCVCLSSSLKVNAEIGDIAVGGGQTNFEHWLQRSYYGSSPEVRAEAPQTREKKEIRPPAYAEFTEHVMSSHLFPRPREIYIQKRETPTSLYRRQREELRVRVSRISASSNTFFFKLFHSFKTLISCLVIFYSFCQRALYYLLQLLDWLPGEPVTTADASQSAEVFLKNKLTYSSFNASHKNMNKMSAWNCAALFMHSSPFQVSVNPLKCPILQNELWKDFPARISVWKMSKESGNLPEASHSPGTAFFSSPFQTISKRLDTKGTEWNVEPFHAALQWGSCQVHTEDESSFDHLDAREEGSPVAFL